MSKTRSRSDGGRGLLGLAFAVSLLVAAREASAQGFTIQDLYAEPDLRAAPPKPSEVQPSSPPALDAVISACIAKQKEQRFKSAEALGHALKAVRRQLGIV